MSLAALFLAVVAFIAVLRCLDAQRVAGQIIDTTQQALATMANGDISDEEKETQIRRASIALFGEFLRITAIGVASFGASVAVVWGGAAFGLYAFDHAIAVAIGWPFLLVSSAMAVTIWIVLEKLRGSPANNCTPADVPYSPLDKALHDFAFASPERQIRLGTLETRLFRRSIDAVASERPVFITSLPRAGTTILLEGLASLPQFASATYQHMPFTLSPLLWGAFSRNFRNSDEKIERAHGDGMNVGIESPEAFEEMLWMAFWPEHYTMDHIELWTAAAGRPDFDTFFRTHMDKIVATKPGAKRYVSKNNANIARLPFLERLFPDATFVVPIRNPRAQVQSLLAQHLRFADLHAREPFARRYMEGIGHFEFGAALKPIEFGPRQTRLDAPEQVDFWLGYWIDAYLHVLATAGPRTVFVDYDALCADPSLHLQELAAAIELDDQRNVAAMAGIFRPPRPAPDLSTASLRLIQRADTLHEELCSQAIGRRGSLTGKVMQ